MARKRLLPMLAVLFALLAASAWTAWWAVTSGRLDQTMAMRWAAHREELTVATVAAIVLVIAFRGFVLAAKRHSGEAPRTARHLQTVAALALAAVTFAVIAGDISSTLIGLGLVGFGVTLALQRPILALAGWSTIVFGQVFREGDRIQVGDHEGDVLSISLFTTKLWEIGQPGSRSPGRPTARIRTISNAVFLEQPIANATSDTPIVFDEFVVNVAFESDQAFAEALLNEVAQDVLDLGQHDRLARTYRRLTKGLKMEAQFPERPVILAESTRHWMEYRLRYLVDARRAGPMQAELTRAWAEKSGLHPDRLHTVYPRTQNQRLDAAGLVLDRP